MTVAPLAANTMSGRPGSGLDEPHRVAERAVGVAEGLPLADGPGRCRTGSPLAIHGLIAYRTVKWFGGHIR